MSQQLENLKAKMARIPVAVRAATIPALMKSGEELAARIKTLVPVEHGDLKDSVTVTPPGSATPNGEKTARETQVFVTADAGYATYVEYGHHGPDGHGHVPAHPFFWPAYRLSKKRLQSRIKRAISAAVKAEWSK